MGHEGLTGFFLNNLSLLIALGVGVTAVGIVVAIVLGVLKTRRSRTGVESGQQDLIQKLSRTVQDHGKTIEDFKRQTVESNQDFAKKIKEMQKETRATRKELDAMWKKLKRLSDMVRMSSSGAYETAPPKDEENESNDEKGKEESAGETKKFWKNAKESAEYFIPGCGQWKLIKNLLEKKRTR